MDNAIKVSVVCMAYNHEKYIRKALDGFVMQKTSFAFEVFVHDDASTDNTKQIIKDYAKKYPQIIKPIFEKQNQYSMGVHALLDVVLPQMNGKYIALCEGDDYWIDSQKLQLQYDYLEQHLDCSLVAHDALIYYDNEKYMAPYSMYNYAHNKHDFNTEDVILGICSFPTASMFFSKSFYLKNNMFLHTIPNYDYALKALLSDEGVAHVIPRKMSVYRKGTSGSWTERVSENNSEMIKHLQESIDIMEKIDKYTEYRHSDDIQKSIMQRRFQIIVEAKDIKSMTRNPYKDLFHNLGIKRILAIYLDKYCHPIYILLLGVYRKMKKRYFLHIEKVLINTMNTNC